MYQMWNFILNALIRESPNILSFKSNANKLSLSLVIFHCTFLIFHKRNFKKQRAQRCFSFKKWKDMTSPDKTPSRFSFDFLHFHSVSIVSWVWTVLCWQVTRTLYQFLISDWINNSDKLTTISAFIQIHVILSRIRSLKVNFSLFRIVLDFSIRRFPCTYSTLLFVSFYFFRIFDWSAVWWCHGECVVDPFVLLYLVVSRVQPCECGCIHEGVVPFPTWESDIYPIVRNTRMTPRLTVRCANFPVVSPVLLDAKYSACVITSILR
jgi:hypothetical protein